MQPMRKKTDQELLKASGLTSSELAAARRQFMLFDADGSGEIDGALAAFDHNRPCKAGVLTYDGARR